MGKIHGEYKIDFRGEIIIVVFSGSWNEECSEEFIKKYGRLGRSWGCPALPVKSAGKIIDEIKNGTCLFIYAKNEDYLLNSNILNQIPIDSLK